MTSPDTRPTVVITSRSFSSGAVDLTGRLERAGLEVVRAATNHDLEALRDPLAHAVAWVAGTAPVTKAHFALAPELRVVARYGVGVDAVDLAAARAAGVVVTNTPGANSEAVAEHAISLLMAALRAVASGDMRVRAGQWSVTRGRQLRGCTAAVVGFGRIGRGVAERLAGLGCRVIVHDPFVADADILATGYSPATLPQVRDEADVVSLHAPGGAVVIDDAWAAQARPGQTIVNTARADLVDEAAVAAGLRSGRLFAFAADTLASEAGEAGESPLLSADLIDRVVVTPHLGAQTIEAVDGMGTMAVDEVLAVLEGRPPAYPVTPAEVGAS